MLAKTLATTILLAVAGSMASPVAACSLEEATPSVKMKYRRDSKPVETAADCSFRNGGIFDTISGGPAKRLGNGRFYQHLTVSQVPGVSPDILVVDCDRREAIRLFARFVRNARYQKDTCGAEYGDQYPILAPQGPLTLLEGATLDDLAAIAEASGTVESDTELFVLTTAYPLSQLPRKDRIDLLCGCKLYYPDSSGAKS